MRFFWECDQWPGAIVDPEITSMSWLETISGSEGFLACGSQSGALGITLARSGSKGSTVSTRHGSSLVTCTSNSQTDTATTTVTALSTDNSSTTLSNLVPIGRCNYNLLGHRGAVCFVRWNQKYCKMASCDSTGMICVWMRYEDRWSVELVNDRGIQIRDFCWTCDGSRAFVSYVDNFVLVGSAAGHRHWSSVITNHNVCCCAWMPFVEGTPIAEQRAVIGCSDGVMIVLDGSGVILCTKEVRKNSYIKRLEVSVLRGDGQYTVAVLFADGCIYLMNGCEDCDPIVLSPKIQASQIQWALNGAYLAVAGSGNAGDINGLYIDVYSYKGCKVCTSRIPERVKVKITAFSWALNDSCIFVAAGGNVHTARVCWQVPSLQLTASYFIWLAVGKNSDRVKRLPIPANDRELVHSLNTHVLQGQVPETSSIYQAVCTEVAFRHYCTIRPLKKSKQGWELCYEHVGGLIPVLRAHLTNRWRPEFEVFVLDFSPGSYALRSLKADSFQRDSLWRRSKRQFRSLINRDSCAARKQVKVHKLAVVLSNIWCTRFKIITEDNTRLPPFIGDVEYKTSLLHLQPRQMVIHLVHLKNCWTRSAAFASSEDSSSHPGSKDSHNEFAEYFLSIPRADWPVESVATRHSFASRMFCSDRSKGVCRNVYHSLRCHRREVSEDWPVVNSAVLPASKFIYVEFSVMKMAVASYIHNEIKASREVSCYRNNHIDESSAMTTSTSPTTALAASEVPPCAKSQSGCRSVCDWWDETVTSFDYIDTDEQVVSTNSKRAKALSPGCETASWEWLISHLLRDVSVTAQGSQSRSDDAEHVVRSADHGKSWNAKVCEAMSLLTALCHFSEILLDPSLTGLPRAFGEAPPKTGEPLSRNMASAEANTLIAAIAQVDEVSNSLFKLEGQLQSASSISAELKRALFASIGRIRAAISVPTSARDHSSATGMRFCHRSDSWVPAAKSPLSVITLRNKTPAWNDAAQVYQLDFNGRVTLESAKNFQVEYNNRQILQFGRIDGGRYSLDFEAPFSVVQAFAIALASITQRLK